MIIVNRSIALPEFTTAKKITIPAKLSLAGICFILFQTPVIAGGVVGTGTPGSCTDKALKTALNGGGTVTFNCGGSPHSILLGSENKIAASTVIDGGNLITINGGNAVRLFKMAQIKNLTLKNLTLANGYTSGQGAAVYADYKNSLVVKRCKFVNNVAKQLGEAGGGAIYSSNGTLAVENSGFENNRASLGGAVRVLNSNLSVISSAFTKNKAVDFSLGSGGAIYVDGAKGDGGQIVIRDSSFTGNSAMAYGGALFNSLYNDNKTAITGSLFEGNYVGGGSNGQGGAIWSNGDPVFSITGHWKLNRNTSTLTIVNTVIKNNTATQQGGGLFLARHPQGTVISQSTITGNKVLNSNGAGIMQASKGKLSLLNSTVSDNKTVGPYSMGAGVFVVKESTAFITNATISNNTANWQAGGVFGGSNTTLKNSILANNVALNGGNNWNIKHNCFQPMTNGGNNIQFPKPKDAPCTGGMLIADPKLDSLKNNGGATPTRALLSGSVATGRGGNCPTSDQRGVARAKPAGTYCDIGAYEASF